MEPDLLKNGIASVPRLADEDVILAAYRGSVAHGTYVPSEDPDSIDDVDYIGVFLPPIEHYYGVRPRPETEEIFEGVNDVVLYELVRFVNLMRECNPNILATLWAPPRLMVKVTDAGQTLIDIREAFLSKRIFKPFIGYAQGQIKKMSGFHTAGFKGDKRKELIERFGYDCKNASHLIRILRMGEEALRTGNVRIDRTGHDAAELMSIKRGEWPLDAVKRLADSLFVQAHEALAVSKLPDGPNSDLIDKVTLEILKQAHG